MIEATLKKNIRAYLDREGIYWVNIQAGYGVAPGAPDMLCVVNGRFLALEGKTYRNTQRDQQKKHEARIEANGGICAVVRSMEDVVANVEYLRGLPP